jgi:hypothetical protein
MVLLNTHRSFHYCRAIARATFYKAPEGRYRRNCGNMGKGPYVSASQKRPPGVRGHQNAPSQSSGPPPARAQWRRAYYYYCPLHITKNPWRILSSKPVTGKKVSVRYRTSLKSPRALSGVPWPLQVLPRIRTAQRRTACARTTAHQNPGIKPLSPEIIESGPLADMGPLRVAKGG